MEFPLAMHQNAFKAAEAAECAGDQGKFWEMNDKLFANQKALEENGLLKNAEALGLNVPKFKECLDGGKHDAEIRKVMAEGQKAGITGTPAFLLGFIQSDGKVRVVKKIVGAQPYRIFKAAIDEIL